MASKGTEPSTRSNTPKAPSAAVEIPLFLPNNNLLPLTLRLDRSNYTFWRSLVLAATRAYNLDGYILGTNPPPAQTIAGNNPNPDYAQWIRLDQFLMHWLMNSITEHILLQIRGLLQSTKKGSSTIDEYILKMKGYADSLAAAGQAISDEDLALYVLGGLGQEYESVVVNLTSRSELLTLQEIQFMLHSQEVRLQQLSATALNTVQANLANLSVNGTTRGRGYRGAYRGGRGYSANRGGRGNRPVCQLCGRVGHTAQKCYHRFDITYNGPPTQGASPSNSSSDNPQANIPESSILEESPGTWYLDTGETNHLTSDNQQLNNSTDYKGKAKVVVGNGDSIPILHDKTTRQVLLRGSLHNGLYSLKVPHKHNITASNTQSFPADPSFKATAFNCNTSSNPVRDKSQFTSVWHCRLGHPVFKAQI
uniref:CCHC-type domain-containing protein n=1 Tax=Cannabis sativa TaxID=3483 RepID=A0A803P6J6_CANSA